MIFAEKQLMQQQFEQQQPPVNQNYRYIDEYDDEEDSMDNIQPVQSQRQKPDAQLQFPTKKVFDGVDRQE